MFTMHIYLLLKTSAFCRCRFHSVGHRLSVFRTSCVWSWSFIITITENDNAAFSSACKCLKFLRNPRKETKWCLVCKFFFYSHDGPLAGLKKKLKSCFFGELFASSNACWCIMAISLQIAILSCLWTEPLWCTVWTAGRQFYTTTKYYHITGIFVKNQTLQAWWVFVGCENVGLIEIVGIWRQTCRSCKARTSETHFPDQ